MKIGTWNSSFLWNLIIHLLVLNTGNFREWSISSLVIIIPATPSNPSIPYVKTHQWVFMGIQLISQRFCIGTMMWVDHVEPHPYPTKILLKYQKIPYSRNSWICDIFFWEIYIYRANHKNLVFGKYDLWECWKLPISSSPIWMSSLVMIFLMIDKTLDDGEQLEEIII